MHITESSSTKDLFIANSSVPVGVKKEQRGNNFRIRVPLSGKILAPKLPLLNLRQYIREMLPIICKSVKRLIISSIVLVIVMDVYVCVCVIGCA